MSDWRDDIRDGVNALWQAVMVEQEHIGENQPGQLRGLCRLCVGLSTARVVGTSVVWNSMKVDGNGMIVSDVSGEEKEDDDGVMVQVFDLLVEKYTYGKAIRVWRPCGFTMVKVKTVDGVEDYFPGECCTVLPAT